MRLLFASTHCYLPPPAARRVDEVLGSLGLSASRLQAKLTDGRSGEVIDLSSTAFA
jgi:hypothetical protein